MGNFAFDNTYNLSSEQLERLDEAEELMLKGALGKAETLLLSMLEDEADCIPVLYCSDLRDSLHIIFLQSTSLGGYYGKR